MRLRFGVSVSSPISAQVWPVAVDGDKVTSQTGFYRKLWSLGTAGVDVPLTVYHEGVTFDVTLTSIDRMKLLKAPRLH
jgi:S1-C subfamily serine protease